MLAITEVLSYKTPETYVTPDRQIRVRGYWLTLNIFATDHEGRPWRLLVSLGGQFGFSGIRIARTDTPYSGEHSEPDLNAEKEQKSWDPPVNITMPEALALISSEFERAGRADWTQSYTDAWTERCAEYDMLRAMLAGERQIAPYPW